MNGTVRPATVTANGPLSRTIISLRYGGEPVTIKPGDEFTGFINEHGNFYIDGKYVGSVPHDFTEI